MVNVQVLALALAVFAGVTAGFQTPRTSNGRMSTLRSTGLRTNTALYADGVRPRPESKPILDTVNSPNDIKRLSVKELKQLSHEIRWECIEAVSKTGGHLSSSLGVVELTVALHHVFDAPEDKIVWDVAHQAYIHKILTGRRDQMGTLRQSGGISGFTKRAESEYDCFGAGHSSTSISAALGFSVAKDMLNKRRNNCIAVIGDGAITGGMAYEAMNNAGYLNQRCLVILNDNGQVSLPTGVPSAGGTQPASALSTYTSRLLVSKPFTNFRQALKQLNTLVPSELQEVNKRIDEYARGVVTGGTLFEELGFYYVGPVDGHDLENLVPILEKIRDQEDSKPVLLHVKTEKGYGYAPALAASDRMHGVAKFDVATGKQNKGGAKVPSYTAVFANSVGDLTEKDKSVVGITAAMPGGTGMDIYGKRHPKQMFDVGIAEQHAVTFAAGMAAEGLKPFCAIYSTFMQRGYDQVVHDVVLQKLPVRMILDRGGLVGNDGPTHHGTFDLAYMGTLPNLIIMAPSDEVELKNMIQTAYDIDYLPTVVRFPRGNGLGLQKLNDLFGYNLEEYPSEGESLPVGKGRIIKEAKSGSEVKDKVAILSLGTRLAPSVEAARQIEAENPDISVTVADARFMKPLDIDLIRELAGNHKVLITIEEGAVGGFGDHVLHFMALDGLLDDGKVKVRPMVIPDAFIEAGTQNEQYDEAGLNTPHIVATVMRLLDRVQTHQYSSASL
uniref:1-deoxy-D-xylulose-5-phosphate synthase n=1 Tax=Fibrocapsa japonica TaxID=94617 RepID=A0A7S2XUY7_9STRA|mmetsp:Transcript_11557/g.17080  ORF Transcript_11557/g.17080 Transcript_11557/m.17080 type:complete len:726 (+) Transcript_11557:37-2214(+)|eukprot:CAMPEP_0113938118 /NCGR_PEP_ID=MMETSP1339-20121228/4511_1 /TAXON_ID=94617 /ORGANISM="Fibrocapsa japonica" /LENGTH=725 /DNA_ID=CAMNT_0000941065 /DNA_START=30 /DNA_END=2207 /DNA_ORIENTATION=- /assembly_acc=CAM_ASM_000762